ncbi:Glycoside hydrolase family 43 protein [Pleurostoma richardsiae]|uniref:Glycoside hydrolase family 43 protein n=1 Tax=Pleurostoma richardsiae TaxID=41990 RepID=A0AA38VJG7_9PEZI|nr:Glycoside hydrolase family 43 protein [Pleurostoma richardsiae]
MAARFRLGVVISALLAGLPFGAGQGDNLGLSSGYVTLKTTNFDIQLAKDAQVLVSLKPAGQTFDFLPFDYLPFRAGNGQYHWGDITYRYRAAGTNASWIDGDSSAARQPITVLQNSSGSLAAADLASTLPSGTPLDVTRSWLEVDGDLGLAFKITNSGNTSIEVGSLGLPAEFNSIFTNRTAEETQAKCSLSDPYVGMYAGNIRVTPVSGNGPALVVTPLGDTPLEAYRNLDEPYYDATQYASQVFEGFYEWQVLTKAWAENEWSGVEPWNEPSSRVLKAGENFTVGVRFSLAKDGIRAIDDAIQASGTPYVRGIPGYIIPQDLPAQLIVRPGQAGSVASITSHPTGALTVSDLSEKIYQIQASSNLLGRARLTITYTNGHVQTVHYYIIRPGPQTLSGLGTFLTTEQYFTNTSDPFGRAPSVISYDYSVHQQVLQEDRAWIAGLSDEAGAGSFLAATMKQAVQPDAAEIAKLEAFVSGVMWGTIQTTADHAVRKSVFFYEPDAVPGYTYDPSIVWTGWASWNKAAAYATDRAYDYVHVTAAYWGLYRAGRAYPSLLKEHSWDWYLNQSYATVMAATSTDSSGNFLVGYANDGLMGETVFGELLKDLGREGWTEEADALEANMRYRAELWDQMAVPFGSEMAWDSTGQEGVFYWSKYFGYKDTAAKTLKTVLGFTPTVPHWGWNGNARRYWDNWYGGKLRRLERQLHHYGSGLNALVALSAFRSNTTDEYLLRVGYGGMNGPLSNINAEGFAAASFHSWPETLAWDAYSGDYGPNFVGLALGAAAYLVEDPDAGWAAYGGVVVTSSSGGSGGGVVTMEPRDAARRRVYIAPLSVMLEVDAGVIQEIAYDTENASLTVTLAQLEGGAEATSAVLWIEADTGANYTVATPGIAKARSGWQIPLGSNSSVSVSILPSSS